MRINEANYDACFFAEDQLPDDFTRRLDQSIIDVFEQGKAYFLVEIESLFPEIHNFFKHETTDLFLVRNDLGSRPIFNWAFESEHFNIYSSVPRTNRKLKQMRSERAHFNSLPNYLKPFYFIFNGLDLTHEFHLHPHQGGFLSAFSNWYDLDILTQYSQNQTGIDSMKQKFKEGDIRVIARGFDDEVLLLDIKRGGSLYVAQWGDFTEIKQLLDPRDYITRMFFKSVDHLRRI